jgi:hypothetical protein
LEKNTSGLTIDDGLLPALFVFSRLVLFLTLIPNSWRGVGDLNQYFAVGGLNGWPFINYWVEYPPILPFINALTYRLAAGNPFIFDLILCLVFALGGAACLILFQRLAEMLWEKPASTRRMLIFFGLLVPLPYTWWYMELLPVSLMLLGLYACLQQKKARVTGLVIGLGALVKWFPVFVLPAIWRYLSRQQALRVTLIALISILLVFGSLYLVSPIMTRASLVSQPSRSSWQTAWALIDGNFVTGEYILLSDRTVPQYAGIPRGNPAKIPTLLTLAIFAGFGLWVFWKAKLKGNDLAFIAMVGVTWILFLLWSPGWSPQWILYLLPLALLTLPERLGLWICLSLTFVTLLEWPTLLARHIWEGLYLIVPLRILIFLILLWRWVRQSLGLDNLVNQFHPTQSKKFVV